MFTLHFIELFCMQLTVAPSKLGYYSTANEAAVRRGNLRRTNQTKPQSPDPLEAQCLRAVPVLVVSVSLTSYLRLTRHLPLPFLLLILLSLTSILPLPTHD